MVSLYIHIPFCQNKCDFCSFVISVGSNDTIDAYIQCLEKEAQFYKGTKLKTIYIGGGTPSYLNNQQLSKLIAIVRREFKSLPHCEFTLEANPEGIDFEKAKLLRDLGINRISLGIQSLNDKYLKFLKRQHNSQQALTAFKILRKAKFQNINLDLMYGFPEQTKEEIEKDVKGLTQLESEHLSLYALTIEEKSRFYTKKIKLPDDFRQAEDYIFVTKFLIQNNFLQYEVSNFAKKGKESAHNLVYWQGGNYIGLGVGAHSHIDGERFWNVPRLHGYLKMIKQNTKPMEGFEQLNNEERLIETILFGLRLNQGVDVATLEKRFNARLDQKRKQLINQFVSDGLLIEDQAYVRATEKGRLLLDELCARFI